ncbi:hypothetical protein SAMN05444672_101430 [Bacillus sp. OK838]|nr:hypothetical protein SAMN05444672_101430 [Bacillus sp. OK838]
MGSGMHPVVNESILEVVKLAYEAEIFVQIPAGYRCFFMNEEERINQSRS